MTYPLAFYAVFTASKVGVDSLTVTWDIEQIARADGTRTALVTDGATNITIGRRGLYGYLLSGADLSLYDYIATAITADTGVDSKEVPAVWSNFAMPSVAQSGDAYARLGAPAGASVSADIAVIYTDTQRVDALIEHVESEPDGPPEHDRFTSEALETSPFLDSPEIRDAVWEANLTSYQSDGSTGEALKNIEDTVDSAIIGNSALLNEMKAQDDKLDVIDGIVDSILEDTGTDGVVLADDAITSDKFDESTAFPQTAADIAPMVLP